jgi:hypothetical protein
VVAFCCCFGFGCGLVSPVETQVQTGIVILVIVFCAIGCGVASGGSDAGEALDAGHLDGGGTVVDSGQSVGDGGLIDAGGGVGDAGNSQESYQYPDCDGGFYGCPNLLTVYCALEVIRVEHASCTSDSDCTRVDLVNRCIGWGVCRPSFVGSDAGSTFQSEAQAEIDRYCHTGTCMESPSCVHDANDYIGRCLGGQCTAQLPDGGG